jgi:hypothetical protein
MMSEKYMTTVIILTNSASLADIKNITCSSDSRRINSV